MLSIGIRAVLFIYGTNRPKRWILRVRGWWSTTTKRSPSSTSQETTSPLTQARVTRKETRRRRGASRRSSTTTAMPRLLHTHDDNSLSKKKTVNQNYSFDYSRIPYNSNAHLLSIPLGKPPTLMERTIRFGVIKCIVIYSLSILAFGKL